MDLHIGILFLLIFILILSSVRRILKRGSIYTITGISWNQKDSNYNLRCFGYYHNLRDAFKSTKTNTCDINEMGFYNYVVIEEQSQGVYFQVSREWWFEYDNNKDKYIRTIKPSKFKSISNFGIG